VIDLIREKRSDVKARVLVVEDNKDLIDLFSRQLQILGFQVSVAKNGVEALAVALTDHPDVILMDIEMPGMNGLETVSRIRANPETRRIPVMAITGWAFRNSRQTYMASGFNDYIAKPFTHKELLPAIAQLLRDSNKQSEASSMIAPAKTRPE